jgi:hypothetical protein
MSNLSNPKKYYNLTPQQAANFLKEVIKRVKSDKLQAEDNSHTNWNDFGREMNGQSDIQKVKLVNNYQVFYFISLQTKEEGENKSYALTSIKAFLTKYFSEVLTGENYNDEYGSISETQFNAPKKEHEGEIDFTSAYNAIEQHQWVLFTFGEKAIEINDESHGEDVKKRIFYVKERPVKFYLSYDKFHKTVLKNSDKPLMPENSENIYEGNYSIFTKKKRDRLLYYLETKPMDGNADNGRYLRLLLCFGELVDKKFGEFGIGIFTGIRDGGALFSGIALLVKQEILANRNKEDVAQMLNETMNAKTKFHKSFVDKPLTASIRMLLERRNRAFIKLPRTLKQYTLEELKQKLIRLRDRERESYEAREILIHRTNAFISIPLFFSGNNEVSKVNRDLLNRTEALLRKEPFGFSQEQSIVHGLKKYSDDLTDFGTTDIAFEYNFDHIAQSKFFIFVLPDIDLKDSKISTAFLELGYAWGLRKKIIIFCSEKMYEILPKGILKFDDGVRLLTITCKPDIALNLETIVHSEMNYQIIKQFINEEFN